MSIELGNAFWKKALIKRDDIIYALTLERDSVIALTKEKHEHIQGLENRVTDLESQLSIAFEIMTDRQIEENKHLFQQQPNKGDSDSTNNNGDETQ